ncbi:MAG: hypothetical protein AVDCRST_MAG56-5962 [uncultured Cytophagales bacterium]|uniref:Uncharacterized protein n=1 Tax=uncultured Cytophagales bacterium TaxID=158755 RepID=A0A6J4KIQ5_9SPHI|nr:MAG: hypothetical protein AVDCRST_MAG56-5962 [uncultured Cytophagales bacterium]
MEEGNRNDLLHGKEKCTLRTDFPVNAAHRYGSPPFFKEGPGVVLLITHCLSNTNKSIFHF